MRACRKTLREVSRPQSPLESRLDGKRLYLRTLACEEACLDSQGLEMEVRIVAPRSQPTEGLQRSTGIRETPKSDFGSRLVDVACAERKVEAKLATQAKGLVSQPSPCSEKYNLLRKTATEEALARNVLAARGLFE